MSDFSPTKFIDELYNNYYLKYLLEQGIDHNDEDYKYANGWCFEPTTHNFVATQLSFIGDRNIRTKNLKKHYELLRLIIYTSCKYNRDKNYSEFLTDILLTLLEEAAISLAHKVPTTDNLHSLLSKPLLFDIFYDGWDGCIKISNTSVHHLLRDINEDICRVIKEHISTSRGSTRPTIFKKTRKVKNYKPDSDASDAEGRKKKYRKSKKSKKSKKSRKSNKY